LEEKMKSLAKLSDTNMRLNSGTEIPALGFGTLIPSLDDTIRATKAALEMGFRQFDAAERYRNEEAVGEVFQEVLGKGSVKRQEIFIGTKLWNNNHRPERVKPAFEASLRALRIDYADLYLIHTPFAFQPGVEQDPRDERGEVIYDHGVTLLDTWGALERLVDEGKCRAIGLADVTLEKLQEVDRSARIRPAVVQVESHPYHPQWEMLEYCKQSGIVFQAFAPLGHSFEPRLIDDPVIKNVASQAGVSTAQACIAWAVQRGTAVLTTSTKVDHLRASFDASFLSESAINEISAIQTRYRFNQVVETGVPGFIPRASSAT
jgi:diketogulonate reductase-like aldo/keto reductase